MACDQDTRDLFRVSVGKVMVQHINPPVPRGAYTGHFWPVVDPASRLPIDDLFVVGPYFSVCVCVCVCVCT